MPDLADLAKLREEYQDSGLSRSDLPVNPIELWRHPPFEPTVEGDKLVARGATDDKGQSFAHVKAIGAMLAERGRLPVNVKFLVEGEEEAGGQSIDDYVRQDGGKKLAADCVVIVTDQTMHRCGMVLPRCQRLPNDPHLYDIS